VPADDELLAVLARTQARIRELEAIMSMLVVRHGQDVGLGTWQLRITEPEAFELRAQLPSARGVAVVVSYDDGYVVNCI
jgi:hypothetical protein